MNNHVDTSPETVSAEFEAAEQAIGTDSPNTDQAAEQVQQAQEEAQAQAEIAMATGMINTSLRLALTSFSGVSVNEQITQQAAESYAVLIIKYFPGGLFGLLDRYKEELTAVTATVMLVSAVSKEKAKLAEQEEQQNQAATAGGSNGQA